MKKANGSVPLHVQLNMQPYSANKSKSMLLAIECEMLDLNNIESRILFSLRE